MNAVPPEEPIISDIDGNELKGLIGPFNEADQLKLICTTNGGMSEIKSQKHNHIVVGNYRKASSITNLVEGLLHYR